MNLARLETEYFDGKPDLEDANQFVMFGTSGHCGTGLNGTFTPGNHAPIGGVKVVAKFGWFTARPSGTENVY